MTRRRRSAALLAVLWAASISSTARGQAPDEMAATASDLAGFQNPDGGFGGEPGGPSTLGATSSALKSLKNVRGSVPNVAQCQEFVRSCRDESSGGFAPKPGGEPDVGTTASGLMAIGELKIADEGLVEGAVAFLDEHVKSFLEVRIAVAGLEAVDAKPPRPEQWAETVNEGRNADGTWGEGASTAFETGGHAVALLRMGLDLGDRDPIARAILGGQDASGAWSESGGEPDLSATYRIMRAVFMMDLRPDMEALRSYIARCRNSDGGYGTAPGRPSSSAGIYLATTVDRWARLLGGEPEYVETRGFVPLFDGESLEGWEGDKGLWKVEDGRLVGDSPGIDHNEFLVAPGTYGDFILKISFRLRDGEGNSGVQFRSVRIPGTEMKGYQADVGEGYWGALYDESRRNRVLVSASKEALAALDKEGWNYDEIRAIGGRITISLNGRTSVDYTEDDPKIARDGRIAVQVHAGGPMRVEFKDVFIQPIPSPVADDKATPGFHLRRLGGEPDGRKYTVYLPDGYDASKKYPVVLFLHGSGERGDDGVRSAEVGLGPNIARRPAEFPAIAVFPQARETWAADSDDAEAALDALDEVIETFSADPDRVALTGLSMGGFGAWGLAAAHPERFVAVAPVCGFAREQVVAPIVAAKLPVWTFVGDADSPRIVESTRALAAALRDAGASNRETEYRGVGHNSWDRAYSDPDLLRWLIEPR